MTSNRTNTRRTGIARALSKLGYCSRSKAFSLIKDGRVRLNGRLVRDPETPVLLSPALLSPVLLSPVLLSPVLLSEDRIEVDGHQVSRAGKVYLILNKPRGFVTTAKDEKGRRTIYTLLPEYRDWLAPVGRLDMASEGLLLLTNDSEWGARITSPESHIDKTYHVQVSAVVSQELLESVRKGVRTKDGDVLSVKHVGVVRHGNKNSWLEIVLDEGKNRHIRRLLAELDIEVLRLVRVAIGPLQLGGLPKGKSRELGPDEVKSISR